MYELIIRLQDPSFDKPIKKAIKLPREKAYAIWKQAKDSKDSVEFVHEGVEYMLSPNDVLQVRQAGMFQRDNTKIGGTREVKCGYYNIDNKGRSWYVFALSKTNKLPEGWSDIEYEELNRIPYEKWKKMPEEEQLKEWAKL